MADEATSTISGCKYKSESDSICKYLAQIVDDRDTTMAREFKEQNKLIRAHNTEVIQLLTAQGDLMREVRIDVNTNLKPVLNNLVIKVKNHEDRLWVLEKRALRTFFAIMSGVAIGLVFIYFLQ